jgi:hypothetical protein
MRTQEMSNSYKLHSAKYIARFGQAGKFFEQLKMKRYDGGKQMWARARFVLRLDMIKDGLDKTEQAMVSLKELTADTLAQ